MRVQPELLGRAAELAQLSAFLDRAATGLAAMALVGPAGIGKTVLWRQGLRSAAQRGWTVVSARPNGAEVSLSFSGLADLFGSVDLGTLVGLPPVQRRALDVALLKMEAGPGIDARTVSTAALSVLRELAAATPVLVAIDDAHWLDPATARALGFAVRRLEESPVGLLVTLRDDGATTRTVLGSVPGDRRATAPIGPLDAAMTKDLLRLRYPGELTSRSINKITQASAGNPFYAIEIAREVVRAGPGSGAVPVPAQLGELIQARFARLPRGTRETLLVVACSSKPRVSLVDRGALNGAEAAGLVVVEADGAVRFTHPLFAAAIYQSVPIGRRRALHRALAGQADDPEQQARHLALGSAGPDPEIAAQLDAAAMLAQGRGSPGAAAELIELALELGPVGYGDRRTERLVAGATMHLEAGDVARAEEMVAEALLAGPQRGPRASALRLAAHLQSRTAGFAQAVELASEALTAAGEDLAAVAALHLDLVFVLTSLGDFAAALPHAEAALESAVALGLDAAEAQALAVRTVIRFLGGGGLSEPDLARALELEDPSYPGAITMRPPTIAGLIALFSGYPGKALDLLDKQRQDALEQGRETDSALMSVYLVWAAVWKGDIGAALAIAEEAQRTAAQLEDHIATSLACTAGSLAHAFAGQETEARADAARARDLFDQMGWRAGSIWVSWALGFLELSLGHHAAVDAVLGPLTVMVGDMRHADPALVVFLPDEVDALISLGRFDQAQQLLDPFERQARALGRTWALAAATRCAGLLRSAQGDVEGALVAMAEAVRLYEDLELPFERTRTLLELGCLQRRRKLRRLARQTLAEAYEDFCSLGAPIWAARSRAELARVAARAPAAGLTATEEGIARLAADGLTNRAIALRTFVTVKTVEANLARVYRKLGVASRAQLARALDGYRADV